jgi:glyoxylase-like metal-dependent hydrolase (beta-lactamase superfamily II)
MIERIRTIDTHQFDMAQTGAVYWIPSPRPCLIESGTALAAPIIEEALSGTTPEIIFLTHIHLDHAGGAGHLARTFPTCKIVAHERGFAHLHDPALLIEGVRSASPDLFERYGEPMPIPEEQLIAVRGGEVFDLGEGARIEVVASPGHAPHHVCYFEHASQTLFTGDAVGNWNTPVDVPLTVPPRFDLSQALDTLNALRRLHPARLAFTHFGMADDALAILERYERQLGSWFERIRKLLQDSSPDKVIGHVLGQPPYDRLSAIEKQMIAMCVRGAIASLQPR